MGRLLKGGVFLAGLVAASWVPRWAEAGPITLIGTATLSGAARDFSGLTGTLGGGAPHNLLGGLGSGIAYTGFGNQYVAVPDRGPNNGLTSYIDRFEVLNIQVNPASATPVTASLTGTTLLSNGSGQFFTGNSAAFDAS